MTNPTTYSELLHALALHGVREKQAQAMFPDLSELRSLRASIVQKALDIAGEMYDADPDDLAAEFEAEGPTVVNTETSRVYPIPAEWLFMSYAEWQEALAVKARLEREARIAQNRSRVAQEREQGERALLAQLLDKYGSL